MCGRISPRLRCYKEVSRALPGPIIQPGLTRTEAEETRARYLPHQPRRPGHHRQPTR